MDKERQALKQLEEKYEQKARNLRAYIRELTDRSTEQVTGLDVVHPHLQKAEHDAEFYESQIKHIHEQLHSPAKESDN